MKPGLRGPNRFLRALDRLYCRLWQRLPSQIHTLPAGPLILVGNHRSGVDPLLVLAAVDRPLCFLMAREYFHKMWYLRWLFRLGGVIPVRPGGANRHALAEAIEALQQGNAVCVFPEGAANPEVPLQHILPGAVIMATESGAPILPFRVSGVWPFDHRHVWRPFFRRGRARIRFGKPITVPRGLHDKERILQWTEVVRQAIKTLK